VKKNLWKPLLILLALFYLLFSVGRVVYQSYSVNKEISSLKTTIDDLRKSNKQLSEQILYYQSPSYREKIARERMGLQKPGEEVMVILPEEKPKEVTNDPDAKFSNPQKWWNFFFKNE
jgi:cell division protein FtsL